MFNTQFFSYHFRKDLKKPGVIKKEPYLLDQASKYYNISLVSFFKYLLSMAVM
jgi:hypothetical protein